MSSSWIWLIEFGDDAPRAMPAPPSPGCRSIEWRAVRSTACELLSPSPMELARWATILPCIMPSTAKSSSSMSSVECKPSSFVCNEAMVASFSTTLSSRIISVALLMSSTSSSCCSSPSLNLKTVVAISRTVLSIRSRGRTASSVTVLVRKSPLKSITMTMKTVVMMLRPACRLRGSCMLKPTIITSLFTNNTEALRCGSSMAGVQFTSSFSHMKTSRPTSRPMQAM
mmetsp:Transcript_68695/g.212384  ORF Transcript_68695/g.212384 Transcript_68695/m.212384 type:complete len:227 (+) Transcript_68695:1165-1845(+)